MKRRFLNTTHNLLYNVWEKPHEACVLHRSRKIALRARKELRMLSANDASVRINEFLQGLDVFVVERSHAR